MSQWYHFSIRSGARHVMADECVHIFRRRLLCGLPLISYVAALALPRWPFWPPGSRASPRWPPAPAPRPWLPMTESGATFSASRPRPRPTAPSPSWARPSTTARAPCTSSPGPARRPPRPRNWPPVTRRRTSSSARRSRSPATARPWSRRPRAPPAPAPATQGAAYVFSDAAGTWTLTAELSVPGTAELGSSLAISADASTIVAGRPDQQQRQREAFVFTKSGSTYVQTQELTEPAAASTTTPREKKPAPAPRPALLGDSTAISANGSTIAFGEEPVGVTDVFTKAAGASTWTQTAQLHGGGARSRSPATAPSWPPASPASTTSMATCSCSRSPAAPSPRPARCSRPRTRQGRPTRAGSNIGISADGSVVAFGAPTATPDSAFEAGEVFVATESNAAPGR